MPEHHADRPGPGPDASRPTRRRRLAAVAGLLALVAPLLPGCAVGRDYHEPDMAAPAGWSAFDDPLPATRPTTLPSVVTNQPIHVAEWWTTFDDPVLDELVDEAVRSNYDLRLAGSRLREARSQRGVVAGRLYPQVNANGSYSHARISETGIPIPTAGGSRGPVDLNVKQPAGSSGGGSLSDAFGFGPDLDLFQLGFDANWELDVFGGTQRNVEAAEADIEAGIEDRRNVLVTLLAEVARNYIELRGFQRQLAVARDTLAAQQRSLELTRERRAVGMTTELDVDRAASQVATTTATIPGYIAAARQRAHAIAVLLGRQPGDLGKLAASVTAEAPIPRTPAEVPIGLPSDLLRRRPDLRRAERELAAATARTAAATADLFPRFSLTGSGGLQSLHLDQLFRGDSAFYSIGPGVTWPIFDAGRIRSNIQVQTARQEQALLRYERAVITSLREVEDALSAYAADQVRRQSLADAAAADRQAVAVATDQYRQGLVDFLIVLDAERSLFRSEQSLADSEQAVATDLVALYKALGGGWEIDLAGQRGSGEEPPGEGTSPPSPLPFP